MSEARSHVNYVLEWLKREANDCGTEQLVDLLELAMIALWNRAYLTLGEVTLSAIVDRVVYSASEQFPPFESLKVTSAGIDFQEMRGRTANFNDSELTDGIRFIVTEFLVVIGNLTAEILTPALHAELLKVSLKKQTPGGEHGKGKA